MARCAHHSAARIAIVRGAVAIIVEAVAEFRRRLRRLAARDRAIRANLGSGRANTGNTRRARIANRCRIIIDRAIAIVVEAIADFSARIRIPITHGHAARARRCSWRTHAELPRAAHHTATRIAIVHGAIAIVVEAVAKFG